MEYIKQFVNYRGESFAEFVHTRKAIQ